MTSQSDTDARIKRIEEAVTQIGHQIRLLESSREAYLRSDPEYASYLDAFELHRTGEPLDIRSFYEHQRRLEELNAEFDRTPVTDSAACEQFWNLHRQEIAFLEHILVA